MFVYYVFVLRVHIALRFQKTTIVSISLYFRMDIGKDHCTKKLKFSIKDFFSKCDQIRSFLRIWLHLLKKFLMENFLFCAVDIFI